METRSSGRISLALAIKTIVSEKKKRQAPCHTHIHTQTLSTHNLSNEARVIQLHTSKKWAESFLLDFYLSVHKTENAFQWGKSQV